MDFVFGYGSLIERESRMRTTPEATSHVPVIVRGIDRGWWMHGAPIGYSTTFLAIRVVDDPTTTCNGVVYRVGEEELAQTDAREGIYQRVAIDHTNIEWLADPGLDESELADAAFWAYVSPSDAPIDRPDRRFPLVQSYIDICLNGCLEVEKQFPLASEREFARMFLRTTRDWSRDWVNDRLYPRRPFIYVPRAFSIDLLLHEELGELFDQIQIEPAMPD